MTTNLVIGEVTYLVYTTRVCKSKVFNDIINRCHNANVNGNVTTRVKVTLTYPSQYLLVSDMYLKYIVDDDYELKFTTNDELGQCLGLCHLIEDNSLFDICINFLLTNWSTYYTALQQLSNSNLLVDIYLRCPYTLIPESYRGYYDNSSQQYKLNLPFFIQWLTANQYKEIVTDNNDVYSVEVTRNSGITTFTCLHSLLNDSNVISTNNFIDGIIDTSIDTLIDTMMDITINTKPTNMVNDRLTINKLTMDNKVIRKHGIEIVLSTERLVTQVCYYNDGLLHGYNRKWVTIKSSSITATTTSTKTSGYNTVLVGEKCYHYDKEHGVWHFWYVSGTLRYLALWSDGKKCGIWYEYYDTGDDDQQVMYEYTFDRDTIYSNIKHYYQDKNHHLNYELKLQPNYCNEYWEWNHEGTQKYFGCDHDGAITLFVFQQIHITYNELICHPSL